MDDKDILQLLKDCGAIQLPGKKHEKWQLPNGQIFIRASTPSDRRAYDNQAARLKRQLGEQTNETKEGVPSKRKYTKGPSRQPWGGLSNKPFNRVLAEQLQKSGVVEAELREVIARLEVELQEKAEESHEYMVALTHCADDLKRQQELAKSWAISWIVTFVTLILVLLFLISSK